MARSGEELETWACNKAQEIVLREGFDLIRSAREGNNIEIRHNSMTLAKAIAASLVEASTPLPRQSRSGK